MMAFLAPLFFAALAALAVPVLIHLVQRERKNVIVFPSLMFLRKIPYQSVRRRRLRHWALLAMRLAALALIIAAFARPFLRGADLAAASGGARDVVILLDRSYSMGFSDAWRRAQEAARTAVNGLGAADRASLVLFSTAADVGVRRTEDRARLIAEIDATEPSAGATRYAPALKLAGSLLAESTLPRREVVLISDFQRSGWTPGDGLRLPSGTTLTPVSIQPADATNVSVTPVSLQREVFSGQERVIVNSGLINRSDRRVDNLGVVLEFDGRPVQTTRVSLEPRGSGSVAFPPVTITARNTRATVRTGDDALARDNAFHFVLSPPEPLAIALVSGSRGARDSALYLTRALSIGESPRFDVITRQLDALTDDALSRTSVVVLNDVSLSETAAARLKRFVENGGGVFIIQGPQAAWPGASGDVLPASVSGTVDRTRGPAGTMGGLAYGHVVFEPFRAPRSGDFSAARFYGYRSVTVAKDAQVLARFDDGSPALVERQAGRGRILMWTSTLDLFWNDLPLKPVFLPFVHQVVRHLADYRERAAWSTVGQVIDLTDAMPDAVVATAGGLLVLTPSGERAASNDDDRRAFELTEQGFYEVRQARQGTPVLLTASNVELIESDRTPVDPQEIVASVTGGGPNVGPVNDDPELSDEAQERTQRIWWYLLFAGILLLTAESIVAHRISRSASGDVVG